MAQNLKQGKMIYNNYYKYIQIEHSLIYNVHSNIGYSNILFISTQRAIVYVVHSQAACCSDIR